MTDRNDQLEYDETDAKVAEFLGELGELCKKYGMQISACGCCDSPWVIAGGRTYLLLESNSSGEYSVERPDVTPGDYQNLTTGETYVVENLVKGFTITKDGKR